MVRKGELRVLKEEIEGMRSKSVEIARGNTKSESGFCLSICSPLPVERHVLDCSRDLADAVSNQKNGEGYLTSAIFPDRR